MTEYSWAFCCDDFVVTDKGGERLHRDTAGNYADSLLGSADLLPVTPPVVVSKGCLVELLRAGSGEGRLQKSLTGEAHQIRGAQRADKVSGILESVEMLLLVFEEVLEKILRDLVFFGGAEDGCLVV